MTLWSLVTPPRPLLHLAAFYCPTWVFALPSVSSAAAVDYLRAKEVGAASAPSGRRCDGRGRGGRGGGVAEVEAVVGAVEAMEGAAGPEGVVVGVEA
ncbi:unnamed protein product [Closterium sp. NIES-65]|nr:unnamed protein product [Closterium sp. NIES-65]CAI5940610.1 unnamed protein product [Closterium sp. NIES-65]CAI6008347.1 unnamed protein product [Closterium sp. NIES-65]